MTRAEAEAVTQLMESVLDGERTTVEVSDILEINAGVISAVANRMLEQRLGIPAPAVDDDDLIAWGARRFFLVMWRRWE